jgi:lipid-binding SYLF domain-containing protein
MTWRVMLLAATAAAVFAADSREIRRVAEAAGVFDEVMGIKERAIPQELLDRAECVAVVPSMKKGGFIFAGQYGKGVIACRAENGEGWSGPATIRVEGASFGPQVGGTEVDLVLLIMNRRGANRLLTTRFRLGGDAMAAAGPVGRAAAAETDAMLHAEMIAWSRSRGLFAGVSLTGATLRADGGDNERIYGKPVSPGQIVMEGEPAPESVKVLAETLSKYSSRKHRIAQEPAGTTTGASQQQ